MSHIVAYKHFLNNFFLELFILKILFFHKVSKFCFQILITRKKGGEIFYTTFKRCNCKQKIFKKGWKYEINSDYNSKSQMITFSKFIISKVVQKCSAAKFIFLYWFQNIFLYQTCSPVNEEQKLFEFLFAVWGKKNK